MAVPADLYRVQMTFALGGDGEVAVTGFHAHYADTESIAHGAAAVAEHGYAAWIAGFVDSADRFPSSVVLDSVKAYHVVDSGPSDAIGEQLPGGDGFPAWAGSSATSLPWEVACVVTTEGQEAGVRVTHPRRYRGRMYLPPLAPSSITTTMGFVSNEALTDILNSSDAMLEYFNDTIGGTGPQARAVILSRTGGFATNIKAVSMDNQFDLQKRRQNRQVGMIRVRHADLDA